MKKDNLIDFGFATKVHGVKGGITFHLYNDDESILKKGVEVTLFPRLKDSKVVSDGEKYLIDQISFGNKVIVYLKGISNREDAQAMLPFDIFVSRDFFPDLSEGEFYLIDLEGLAVYSHESQEQVGKVTTTYSNGFQDIIVVEGDGRKWELPLIDQFFPVVDIKGARIEMILPRMVDDR